jgi:hypothetical protein
MDLTANERLGPMATSSAATVESSVSAVSWSAIIAGAVVAASVSLTLLALATGLGLAAVSPWPDSGASLKEFSVTTAIALIVVQWIAACFGGYITGRLRTKWTGTHTHEVFFRDTAHGFITWALATITVATLLTSAVSSLAGAGARGAAAMGDISSSDRTSLTQQVASRLGISNPEAQQRVADAVAQVQGQGGDDTKAREAADTARKASATASIFTALSMIIGAFIASVSAALGGRLRDEHP